MARCPCSWNSLALSCFLKQLVLEDGGTTFEDSVRMLTGVTTPSRAEKCHVGCAICSKAGTDIWYYLIDTIHGFDLTGMTNGSEPSHYSS